MPTHLALDDHIAALTDSANVLRDAASGAGLTAKVPTCPDWDVTALVAHQGMVHRWATARLRGEAGHDTARTEAEGKAAPDPLTWFSEGFTTLVETLLTTPDDAEVMVFLNDAPPPLRFWARRQAHETTIHSVDAVSARLGRRPNASDVSISADLATDGIDELLCGFITRRKSRLRSPEPYSVLIRAEDTGHAWTLRVSDEPVHTVVGASGRPDATFTGTAAQLYLGLWNRSDEIVAEGRGDILDQWREQVQVRWS